MQKEIAPQIISSNPMKLAVDTNRDGINSVSINQVRTWIVPQKAEQDGNNNINQGYFELLIKQIFHGLLQNGYIRSFYYDESEYGEGEMCSVTEDGIRYLEENMETM